jgi:uncharacterized membrane protein YedE/YeeE
VLTGERISVQRTRPERRHFIGAAIFGVGWAVADSCPAPIAAQLTQGVLWSLFTIAGIFIGVEVFLRARMRRADRPAPSAASEAPVESVA